MFWILTGAAVTIAGALALGRLPWLGKPRHWTFALASGAPLLSLCIFALLYTGNASKEALIAVVTLSCAFFAWRPRRERGPIGWGAAALPLVPLAVYFVLYLVHALAPEIQPDGVTYHLGLVAEWLRTGHFAARVGFYEVLPLGLETLFTPAVAIGGFSAAKLVHFAFLCATVPLMFRVGRRLGLSAEASLWAASLYVMAPVVGVSGSAAYNDAALVFFGLATFALLQEETDGCAGLAAGFCYAIKITGLLAVPAGLGWLLWKRRWRGAALFVAGAMVSVLPWMLRTLLLTGNPLAPLGNRIFPNAAFHAVSEEGLARYLANYGNLSWIRIPWAITVDGAALQGLIGPVFLLLPLALLAWRKPAARAVLGVALLLLVPWTRNLGTRFVMPALPFLCFALALALPRPAMLVLVLAHAITCWPAVVDRYAGQGGWRLHGFPWQAALRMEPEVSYLAKNLFEYRYAQMVARHVQRGDGILDLFALPYAYLPTVPIGPLESAQFDNLRLTLTAASRPNPEILIAGHTAWPLHFVRGVRVRMTQPIATPWNLAEVELLREGHTIPVSARWFLDARPAPGDAWLAMDGNRASRWSSWDDSAAGMYWQVTFDRPMPLDGVRVLMPNLDGPQMLTIETQEMDRQWKPAASQASLELTAPRLYRRSAIEFLKRQGIQWIVVRIGAQGNGPIGQAFLMTPEDWGVELVEKADEVALFRLR
ncbi:MAG TPA: glycosyltransferase 87 family protein [Paludibaculum sp.]|jgi:hypothetical protein